MNAEERRAEIQRIIALLHKWGIHTLGELAALPVDELSTRLGSEAMQLWQRANGTSTRLLNLVQPVELFAESFEFEHEIETSEPLLFMLRRFLEQISRRLGTLYFVARELTLLLSFSDKKCYEHRFKIPQPTRSVEVLFRMLHTHLENFTSEFPIVAVSLSAVAAKPAQQQFGLFETALRDPAQLSETLARLTGLLGPERVGMPVVEETHRPDAFHLEPFVWQLEETAAIEETPLPSYALRRFRPPVLAAMLLAENKPVHLRSAEWQGVVQESAGPYRSSGHWWDEGAWGQAEWDVQLESGALCQCHEQPGGWFVEGVYD
jgi:protein ImuB